MFQMDFERLIHGLWVWLVCGLMNIYGVGRWALIRCSNGFGDMAQCAYARSCGLNVVGRGKFRALPFP